MQIEGYTWQNWYCSTFFQPMLGPQICDFDQLFGISHLKQRHQIIRFELKVFKRIKSITHFPAYADFCWFYKQAFSCIRFIWNINFSASHNFLQLFLSEALKDFSFQSMKTTEWLRITKRKLATNCSTTRLLVFIINMCLKNEVNPLLHLISESVCYFQQ